jgi:hypothetical protein
MAQAEWDHMLITWFRRTMRSKRKKQITVGQLAYRYRQFFDDYESLKRRPITLYQLRIDPYRFVCGFLPKLGRILQDDPDADIKAIVNRMVDSNIDTIKDDHKMKAESAMRRHTRLLAAANTLSLVATIDLYARQSHVQVGRMKFVPRV